jgi:hypothetical protein
VFIDSLAMAAVKVAVNAWGGKNPPRMLMVISVPPIAGPSIGITSRTAKDASAGVTDRARASAAR